MDVHQKPDHRCRWCGRDFSDPRATNSVTKRQVIFVRMWIRLADNLIFVHGAVCGKCRNELSGVQVTPMALTN